MPGPQRRPRWLVLLAVLSCLMLSCTPRPPAGAPASSAADPSSVPAAPSASPAPDYVAMKQQLERRLAGNDLSLQAIRAVLVSVDGKTVLTLFPRSGPDERVHIWSVTKSVLSILVGIAIDEGKLRLDQTLPELLPRHAAKMSAEARKVTLRQLLTMTAGVQGGQLRGPLGLDPVDPVGQLVSDALLTTPGETFVYSNGSAHLVAAILRQAVGRPVLDYARDVLFDPLGIDTRPAWQGSDEGPLRQPGFGWARDRDGTNVGGLGLKLTGPDLLKIGQLALDRGRWRGRQLVSARWVRTSTTNQLTKEQSPQNVRYGYFWWLGDIESHPYFAAMGSHGQYIIVVPGSRAVVVTLSDTSGPDETSEEFVQTLNEVVFRPIFEG
jgi:CubicO group peptidase (beta-lactamase class C family)